MDDEEAFKLADSSNYYTGNCSIRCIDANLRGDGVDRIYNMQSNAFRRSRADSRQSDLLPEIDKIVGGG